MIKLKSGDIMIYLDYSATTKVDKKVLERFNYITDNYFANPNSKHKLGLKSKSIIDEAEKRINKVLNLEDKEIIFTSGASESNNLVMKGLLKEKKHIITTSLEHSSILSPVGYLQKQGYKISFAKLDEYGRVDIKALEKMLTSDTFLVSITAVNSETGIKQPLEEIKKVLKKYPNIIFHSDITQLIGKEKIDLKDIDLVSFSGHKIYTFKGIGCLIKNKDLKLTPLIHGGKSTTIYRSGTPQTELIDSISYALELSYIDLNKKQEHVKELNNYLKENLKKYKNIVINSNKYSIPNILNLSILNKESDETLEYFSNKEIYISTKTACSSDNKMSLTIYNLTKDEKRATSSIRISISYKTTKEEIDTFLKELDNYIGE